MLVRISDLHETEHRLYLFCHFDCRIPFLPQCTTHSASVENGLTTVKSSSVVPITTSIGYKGEGVTFWTPYEIYRNMLGISI